MGDAKYPLELFLRVITVSLETMKIVNGLPKLDLCRAMRNRIQPLYAHRDHAPSLPDARPGSERFRCGVRKSNFLAVSSSNS